MKFRYHCLKFFLSAVICNPTSSFEIKESDFDPTKNFFPRPRIVKRSEEQLIDEFPDSVNLIPPSQSTALAECQHQFSSHRWNCTFSDKLTEDTIIQRGLLEGSRETAFISAIQNAALTYVVTVGCSSGYLPECSCDLHRKGKENQNGDWRWGGCSENVRPGLKFARKYFDSIEKMLYKDHGKRLGISSTQLLMNLHNNKAGRLAVKDLLYLKCRCHGVSGSCTFRTCWKSLPRFREIGDHLRDQYVDSKKVNTRKLRSRRNAGRRKRFSGHMAGSVVGARDTDLVHLFKSPNYCRANDKKGILGTKDRECAINNQPYRRRCQFLCCGRGFRVKVTYVEEKCECKFHWCCEVKCKICRKKIKRYICK